MLKISKSLLLSLIVIILFSCKKEKEPDQKKDELKQVVMVGETNLIVPPDYSYNFKAVLWNSNGSQMKFSLENAKNTRLHGIHLIQQVGKPPIVSIIGTAKNNTGASRVCIFINGEKKELATLAGISNALLSDYVLGYIQDGNGNTYISSNGGYYKIDKSGKVTFSFLQGGKLFFDNNSLKSLIAYRVYEGFEIQTCDLNLNVEKYSYAIKDFLSFFEDATCVSAKKIFFFVIVMNEKTKIQINYLLTFHIDTKSFTSQEIGYPNELLNFRHSTLDGDVLHVVGDDSTLKPFYMTMQVSDQSGPLRFNRTSLDPTVDFVRTNQILVANNNVYVSGQLAFKSAFWINGKLVEVDHTEMNQSKPFFLTSY